MLEHLATCVVVSVHGSCIATLRVQIALAVGIGDSHAATFWHPTHCVGLVIKIVDTKIVLKHRFSLALVCTYFSPFQRAILTHGWLVLRMKLLKVAQGCRRI